MKSKKTAVKDDIAGLVKKMIRHEIALRLDGIVRKQDAILSLIEMAVVRPDTIRMEFERRMTGRG